MINVFACAFSSKDLIAFKINKAIAHQTVFQIRKKIRVRKKQEKRKIALIAFRRNVKIDWETCLFSLFCVCFNFLLFLHFAYSRSTTKQKHNKNQKKRTRTKSNCLHSISFYLSSIDCCDWQTKLLIASCVY